MHDDDALGLLISDGFTSDTVPYGMPDLDAVVRAGRRRMRQRRLGLSAASGVMVTALGALVLQLPAQQEHVSVQLAPASDNTVATAPPVETGRETHSQTARRLTKGLKAALGKQKVQSVGPIAFQHALYNMPTGTYQTEVDVDRFADGTGIGLFVTARRAPIKRIPGETGPECLKSQEKVAEDTITCSEERHTDGTLLVRRTSTDAKGRFDGAAAAYRNADGDLITVGIKGVFAHRWPSGVTQRTLDALASTPGINP